MADLIRRILASCIVCAAGGSSLLAAPPIYNTIALSGTAAPDTTGEYSTTFNYPVLNAAGQVAFPNYLKVGVGGVTATTSYGLWSQGSGTLSLIARQGSTAPGTTGVFSSYDNPVLTATGQLGFGASLVTGIGGVTSSNDTGIWLQSGGTLTLVAREGSGAPVTGGVFSIFGGAVFNAAGQTAFSAVLATGGSVTVNNNVAIWSGGIGSLGVVARENTTAPGTTGVFSTFNNPVINSSGKTAFYGYLRNGTGVSSSNDRGIWSQGGGSLALVAREGSAAPGTTDGVYTDFSNPVINAAGQTAFLGYLLEGTGDVTSSNNRGIWSGPTGTISLVARSGSLAAGTTGNFSDFNSPVLNAAGKTAFYAYLAIGSGGVTSNNDRGIWSEGGGSLALVARSGSAAPGTTGDFYEFSANPVMNAAGQTAFIGYLTGSGIDSSNDTGLWATDIDGLKLVVRTGDLFDVDPGVGVDNRTISFINFATGSGGEDGQGMSISDDGLLVFGLSFSDGSSGIFTALVPLPEPGLLVALSVILGLGWRRMGGRNKLI